MLLIRMIVRLEVKPHLRWKCIRLKISASVSGGPKPTSCELLSNLLPSQLTSESEITMMLSKMQASRPYSNWRKVCVQKRPKAWGKPLFSHG